MTPGDRCQTSLALHMPVPAAPTRECPGKGVPGKQRGNESRAPRDNVGAPILSGTSLVLVSRETRTRREEERGCQEAAAAVDAMSERNASMSLSWVSNAVIHRTIELDSSHTWNVHDR